MQRTRHTFKDDARAQERQHGLEMYGFLCPLVCPHACHVEAWELWSKEKATAARFSSQAPLVDLCSGHRNKAKKADVLLAGRGTKYPLGQPLLYAEMVRPSTHL